METYTKEQVKELLKTVMFSSAEISNEQNDEILMMVNLIIRTRLNTTERMIKAEKGLKVARETQIKLHRRLQQAESFAYIPQLKQIHEGIHKNFRWALERWALEEKRVQDLEQQVQFLKEKLAAQTD